MLLVDKYCRQLLIYYCYLSVVYKILNIYKNKDKQQSFSENVCYSNFQNTILYSNDNVCKNNIINKLLEEIYNEKNFKIENVEYTITGYGNTKTKINIKQTKFFIFIEPNNNGFDKYLIQDVIHEYIKIELLTIIKSKNLFKTIIIDKIDDLSYYAQASLRRTMEKYSNKCKFIFLSNNISKIIEPLRSRCLQIRIPSPNNIQIINILLDICYKEDINISLLKIKEILKRSNGNVKIAIWLLNFKKYNIPVKKNWKILIKKIVKLIFSKNVKNNNNLNKYIKKIRSYFYTLYITNIKSSNILKELMITILKKIEQNYIKYEIIELTSDIEKRLILGTRNLIHLEYYIIKLVNILHNKNI